MGGKTGPQVTRRWRAPRPRAAGLLDVVRYGDPQACSPPKSASWREEQSRGGEEERGGELWVGSALPDGTLAAKTNLEPRKRSPSLTRDALGVAQGPQGAGGFGPANGGVAMGVGVAIRLGRGFL